MLCRLLLLLLFLGFFFLRLAISVDFDGLSAQGSHFLWYWTDWGLGLGLLRVRVSRLVCLPDGQRSCPALLSSLLCSPPLIAFINYIIKSVMTERPNHLPSSLVGPLFQLNCRVIVCWVPKLPFSCNRPNRPSDRANQLCVPQKPLPLPVDIFG